MRIANKILLPLISLSFICNFAFAGNTKDLLGQVSQLSSNNVDQISNLVYSDLEDLASWASGKTDFNRVKMNDFKDKLNLGLTYMSALAQAQDIAPQSKIKYQQTISKQIKKIFFNLTEPYEDAVINNKRMKDIEDREPKIKVLGIKFLFALMGIGRDLKTTLVPWDSSVTRESGPLYFLKKLVPRSTPILGSDSLRTSAVRDFSKHLKSEYINAIKIAEKGDTQYLSDLDYLIQKLEDVEPMVFSRQNKYLIGVWITMGTYFGIIDQLDPLAWARYRTEYSGVPIMLEWLAATSYMIRARYTNTGAVFASTVKDLQKRRGKLTCVDSLTD